jgi:hypothetical protein
MINPNALPTSPTVQDFQNLESALDSPDYNNTLNAMRYMQGQRTGGLNRLPQVTVPMQEGGMMEEAMMEQQMPVEPMNPEEQAMMMQQVEQQEPREPNPEVQAMAQQVASFGRGGDKLLLHIRPDEMQGLSSMLTVTINPTTGMPEVFLNKIARAGRRIVKGAAKGVRNITKSKAFKTIAPIALAIAAPYALQGFAPTVFGSTALGGGTAFGGLLAKGTVGGAFATAGLGSLAGNLLAGRKFGDAAKAALITGATAGAMRGLSNYGAGKNVFSGKTPLTDANYQTYQDQLSKGLVEGPSSGPFQKSIGSLAGDGTNYGKGALGKMQGLTADNIGSATYQGGPSSAVQEAISQGPILTPDAYGQALSPDAVSNIADAGSFAKPQVMSGAPTANPSESMFSKTVSRFGDAKDAVVSGVTDRYRGLGSFDKGALMNLGKDVLVADIGASAVEMDNAQQQALEDQQLAQAGYSVAYPSGFGTQRVIRDSSGVVVNATAQDILARALSGGRMQFAPKTTFASTNAGNQPLGSVEELGKFAVDTMQQPLFGSKSGGLIELAQGGEFSGMVPGQGGGMDDNVYMPIKEGPKQVGTLAVSPTEYVVDSYTMAALGDGNPDEGAKVMDRTIKQIRKKAYGTTEQPNEIDGLAALKPMAQGV